MLIGLTVLGTDSIFAKGCNRTAVAFALWCNKYGHTATLISPSDCKSPFTELDATFKEKNIKCSFVKKVPEELICSGCIDYAASKDWAPLNILYCRLPEHHQLRASIPDVKKALIKYFGKFDCKTPDSNLKISVNCSFQVHGSSAAYMNHPPSMAPCIDSKSGAKVAPGKSIIILEIRED